MNSLSQSMRPRHQVLTLKCYPRFQKNAVEVKPNPSELSYLLYYASTRRSKLRKVGAFLEKKTESDVWRLRSGYATRRGLGMLPSNYIHSNVLVTLQILEALIEKCGRDLPLFSANALRILEIILTAHDISLIEESVAAFDAFCSHYDIAQMSADQEHRSQYDRILSLYASYASKTNPPKMKNPLSIPTSMRYRTAGLSAIKALVASPSFAEDDGYHCKTIVPVVLDNLLSNRPDYLLVLQRKEAEKSEKTRQPQHRRRQSQNLSRATISLEEEDPIASAGTTEDVDQRAEEEVGLLALECLKLIFSGETRAHLRPATANALAFAKDHDRKALDANSEKLDFPIHGTWACQLFELMCKSSAVQDRFVILVTAMEGLIRSPIVENDLENQLVLTRIVRWLLKSNVNFIGLSVIDVLVGMIQHILLLLQLGGEGSQIRPHSLKPDALNSHPTVASSVATPNSGKDDQVPLVMEVVKAPSPIRKQLLDELQCCIGDLGTHVYYSDQIGDMISSLLLRLKPNPAPGVENPAAAIENPVAAAEAIADSVQLQPRPHTDGFFSFDTARILALAAVRDIIIVANDRRRAGYDAAARNRVSISVWDGTQWLLRDPDIRVRGAYVEALLTWLKFETTKLDLRAATHPVRKARSNTIETTQSRLGETTRRALSNASRNSPSRGRTTSNFVQLLNMAIFDGAVDLAESESDILMLHLLNHALIHKLGVNGVRHSLPMMYALQDEVTVLTSPTAKVNLGSLTHGYFWALSDFFGFDTTFVGRAIFEEVTRRSQNETWLSEVYVPPMEFDKIPAPEAVAAEHSERKHLPLTVDLRALGYRKEIVDNIEDFYGGTILSPPSSPPASPGRPSVLPALNISSFSGSTMDPAERALPPSFKQAMLGEWVREDVIAMAEHETTRTASLTRSKVGSANGRNGQLYVDQSGMASRSDVSFAKAESLAAPGTAVDPSRRLTSPGSSSRNLAMSSSSGRSVVRVSHLKSVLAGDSYRSSLSKSYKIDDDGDTASESMMSADFSNDSFLDTGLARTSTRDEPVRGSGESVDGGRIADVDIPAVPLVPENLMLGLGDGKPRRMSVKEKQGVDLDRLLDGLTMGRATRPATSRGVSGHAPPY